MKKAKKLFSFALATLTACCACVSVACEEPKTNNPQENPQEQPSAPLKQINYTFKAVDQDGNAIPNAEFLLEDVTNGAKNVKTKTDENGVATITLPAGYKVTFSELPDFYISNAEYTTIEAITSYTLVAKKPVYLTDAGKAVECYCAGEGETLDPPHYTGYRLNHHIYVESGKTYVVSNEANTELVYSFTADQSGKYAIYSIGDVDTVLEHYSASEFYFPEELTPDETADDTSETNKNFYYEMDIPTKSASTPNTFVFRAKDTTVSATFGFVIERIGESSIKDDVYQDVRNENLAKAPERANNQTRYNLNTNYELFYNQTDGYYHISTVDSPYIAMVAINSQNAYENLDVSLCVACQNDSFTKRIPQEDGAYSLILYYNEYVVCDIAGMVYNETLGGRGGYEVQDENAPKINSDGDYPLTKELYEMIQSYVRKMEAIEEEQEVPTMSFYKFLYYYI